MRGSTIPISYHVSHILTCILQSWANLEKVATTHHLAKHVRTIHLPTILHLPTYSSLKEFEEDHKEVLGRESEYIISRPNGGPFEDIPRSRADYYRRYQAWHQGEKTMSKHFRSGTAPKLSLNLLTRLQTVETVGHDVLAVIKRACNRRASWDGRSLGPWRTYSDASRREIETLHADKISYGQDVNSSHLETFICALNVSGATFPVLDLRNSKEILRLGSRFDTARLNLDGLRHLKLYLGYYEWRGPYVNRAAHPISPWLKTLRSLEQLSITQRCPSDDMDIFRIIGEVSWRKLAIVGLWGVQITHHNVTTFLERHRATIHTFQIVKPRLSAEERAAFGTDEENGDWTAVGRILRFKSGRS